MMRKIIAALGLVLLLPLMITKAQDTPALAPIIVQFQNKLIAVSAEYGTSQDLVELPPGQIFGQSGAVQLSPDSTKLVYAMETDPNQETSAGSGIQRLFILDLADGTSTELQAKGGVFDRKVADHVFLAYFTWSVDGLRIYYSRIELDRDNNSFEVQIVYYDMTTQQYHLVARSDPKRSVPTLVAVDSGVMAFWPNDFSWSLYKPDNSVVDVKALKSIYGRMLKHEGQDYYALGSWPQKISTLINIDTGEQKLLGDDYYSAVRSRLAGDQSLITLEELKDVIVYRMLESHKPEKVQVIPQVGPGERVALSPDGQWVAYLQFNEFGHALLRVISPRGNMFELPYLADNIYWGASETIAFHQPAGK